MRTLLHHSIIESAEKRGDAVAFRCRDQSLSYERLCQSAAQLANLLRSLGVRSMDRVGIFMPKSLRMPLSVYGTMMAGAAYVPIDPRSSKDRIRFIVKDSGIRVILACDSKRSFLEEAFQGLATPLAHIVGFQSSALIDSIRCHSWSSLDAYDTQAPQRATRESDLAYLMYTSGSTGMPKGLMHTHQSGMSYARYSSDLYSVSHTDILGNHAPLHFDISTFEYLTGPYAGSTSVLIPEEEIIFPAALAANIPTHRLTFWYSVPLALTQMLAQGSLEETDTSSLRWVLFGGESFPAKQLNALMKLMPHARFSNVYGPAEVNQCTYFHLDSDNPVFDTDVPIGELWSGARGKLVNAQGEESVDGEAGELLVETPTMMQGYWNRSDLNEKVFVFEEPFPGFRRRYYRTGDIMRRDESGRLRFLGRADRQIKLRGYRVELDEIEAAFANNPGVAIAASVVLEATENEKEIVVALSLQAGATFDESKLRAWARERLPHYSVPARIVHTPAFPKTSSGKIDRRQLAIDLASHPLSSDRNH